MCSSQAAAEVSGMGETLKSLSLKLLRWVVGGSYFIAVPIGG